MYGLEVGQMIELERKKNYDEEQEKKRGRRSTVKEQYEIVQICRSQIIVKNKRGSKRGVSIGELIVSGIIHQSEYIEEMRKERKQEEERSRRGSYRNEK